MNIGQRQWEKFIKLLDSIYIYWGVGKLNYIVRGYASESWVVEGSLGWGSLILDILA